MDKFCLSCACPVSMPEFKSPVEDYCVHCVDEKGNLKTRDEVQAGVAEWFLTWQPQIDRQAATRRADIYLKAMPQWAE